MNILVVRADRLGDVLLSTPVFEVIKRHNPRSKICVMVRAGVVPVLQGLSSIDELLVYDPDNRHAGVRGFFRLVKDLTERDFRISVVLQSQWRIALAIFLARVRYRVGPLSKLHSYLFYNRGVRQRRSHVEMHETDYNLQLLRRLGIRVGTRNVPTAVSIPSEVRSQATQWLVDRGWDHRSPLVAVHPGMGGSALNWPESHYLELIRALVKDGRKVLVTAGPTEGRILDSVRQGLGELQQSVLFYGGPGIGSVDFLGGLLSHASLVVAPSTGPLHLAVALGRPVLTFYPPIRVQSAIRWGPYVSEETQATVMVPEVYCGEDFKCRGSLCNYHPCMKSLTVSQALENANRHLQKPPTTRL